MARRRWDGKGPSGPRVAEIGSGTVEPISREDARQVIDLDDSEA